MSTQEEYVNKVMSRLPPIPDEQDIPGLRDDVARHFNEGWTISDSVAFLRCMEEVNPKLDEGIALARMSKILKKYSIP